LALIAITNLSFAQVKPVKPKYNYFIVLPEDTYIQLINIAHNYKDQQIYNQKLTNDQKVAITQSVDMYLFDISKNIKVDSALVADTIRTGFKSTKK